MDTPEQADIEKVQTYLVNEFDDSEISCTRTSSGIEIKLNDRDCKEELNDLVQQNNVRFDREHPKNKGSFRLENGHPYALIISD